MQTRKDLRSTVLMVAVAFLCAAWLSFAWTAMTGLTWASRSARGRIATEDDRARVRHVAVLTTAIAGPVALWALKRR